MKSFNYSTVITEAKSCAPVLTELLYKCTMTPVLRNNTDALVSTIICMLAKHRRKNMSLFQRVVSLVLYGGHCSKMVSDICVVIF